MIRYKKKLNKIGLKENTMMKMKAARLVVAAAVVVVLAVYQRNRCNTDFLLILLESNLRNI